MRPHRLLFFVQILILILGSWIPVSAQMSPHGSIRQRVSPLAPVTITRIQLHNRSNEPQRLLDVSGKWLNQLQISLRNTSTKAIKVSCLDLEFTDRNHPEVPVIYSLWKGKASLTTQPQKTSYAELIQPGSTFQISLPEDFTVVLNSINKDGHQDLNFQTPLVSLRYVLFEDDTLWLAGSLFKQNPQSPAQWLPVPNQAVARGNIRSEIEKVSLSRHALKQQCGTIISLNFRECDKCRDGTTIQVIDVYLATGLGGTFKQKTTRRTITCRDIISESPPLPPIYHTYTISCFENSATACDGYEIPIDEQ